MTTQARPRIAIAGATGAVGSLLTFLMAADAVELVALTRDPAKASFPVGVEAAQVDFARPETLAAALQGVQRLFLAQGGSADQAANEIALIDAAVNAGVEHIVKLSAFGPASSLYPGHHHLRIETHLARQPVAYTLLRPSGFANLLRVFAPHIAAGSWGGAIGDGRVNYIDLRDIAESARVALLAPVLPGAKRAYHLTGPRSWSIPELQAELSRRLDRPVAYHPRTEDEQRDYLLSKGLPPARVQVLQDLDRQFRDSAISETTLTVQELTGHPPRPVTDWLGENIAMFKAA